ncbi:right-handed parallel beta-helix repeat-containing protein (plasmid) [Haloarcula salina]|uniref:right-handed parallel beta-helix repeat-containing protein n=1 Tax=Haloarcula salina TaxID=1429914 RepID=UPI003C6F4CF4
MTVYVTDHGATPDDGTDDTAAIRAAADAAAPAGTVFFPAGTYDVGANSRLPLDFPEDGRWDDLTWKGEDYATTTIRLAGGQTKFHSLWNVTPSTPISNVTIEQLTINGNGRNQDYGIGVGIHADDIQGTTSLIDCRFEDWANTGITCDTGDLVIKRCEFERCGHAAHRISGLAGHGFSLNTDGTVRVEDSVFKNMIGTDGDVMTGSGATLTMDRCIGMGRTEYSALLKINPGPSDVTIRRCISQNRGTMAVKSNPQTDDIGSILLDNVLVDGSDRPALDFPAPGSVTVVDCAFKNVDRSDMRGYGIYTDGIDWSSSGPFSVHNVGSNSDGEAVSIRNGGGTISGLVYDGVSGVGSADGTTLEGATRGDPVSPDVPSLSEIGPVSSSSSTDGSSDSDGSTSTDGSTDSGDSTETTDYGGYSKPAAGSLEWHVPLNENFESIEQDVRDLAQRIAELEKNH